MPNTIYDACEKLNKFAEKHGPDGVARAMRLTGCKGIPGDAVGCVLHDYLSKKFAGDIEKLEVDGTGAAWRAVLSRPFCSLYSGSYRFGEKLESFTGKFDDHQYPELEAAS